MRRFVMGRLFAMLPVALIMTMPATLFAGGDVHKVNHIIVLMQENHSFDNYFGALAYAPGSPYHSPRGDDQGGGCDRDDHRCVDGLTCRVDSAGNFNCSNSNLEDDGSTVFAFHDSRRCVAPDLDHGWQNSHKEGNFSDPNNMLHSSPNDGFVRINDLSEQHDNGVESPTDDQTMAFYNQREIPFYYDLAQKFAIN